MSYVSHLECVGCRKTFAADRLMNLCPDDGRPVTMQFDLERLRRKFGADIGYRPERRDMWRFGRLMALDPWDETDLRSIYSLGEGHTPVLPWPANRTAEQHEFELWIKDEGRPARGYGANPTGSFKDRGMAMVISMARRFGLQKLAVPTQGNAGDSLSEYAAGAGLSAVIAMPENTPMPILGKVAAYARLHDGIELELVRGTIREAGELLKKEYLPQGYFSVATFQEPGWRIEGKKSLGLELAEPGAAYNAGQWKMPDVIVYPTGGGTGILGMWKAFGELASLGLVAGPMPRFVAIQSEATAPLVNAFDSGDADTTPVDPGQTIACGLNVPGGVGHAEVLRVIRASNGKALAVDEAAIGRALGDAFRETGIWFCPEGAACIAALPRCIDEGLILAGDRVVVVNTGSFEKYLPTLRNLL